MIAGQSVGAPAAVQHCDSVVMLPWVRACRGVEAEAMRPAQVVDEPRAGDRGARGLHCRDHSCRCRAWRSGPRQDGATAATTSAEPGPAAHHRRGPEGPGEQRFQVVSCDRVRMLAEDRLQGAATAPDAWRRAGTSAEPAAARRRRASGTRPRRTRPARRAPRGQGVERRVRGQLAIRTACTGNWISLVVDIVNARKWVTESAYSPIGFPLAKDALLVGVAGCAGWRPAAASRNACQCVRLGTLPLRRRGRGCRADVEVDGRCRARWRHRRWCGRSRRTRRPAPPGRPPARGRPSGKIRPRRCRLVALLGVAMSLRAAPRTNCWVGFAVSIGWRTSSRRSAAIAAGIGLVDAAKAFAAVWMTPASRRRPSISREPVARAPFARTDAYSDLDRDDRGSPRTGYLPGADPLGRVAPSGGWANRPGPGDTIRCAAAEGVGSQAPAAGAGDESADRVRVRMRAGRERVPAKSRA